MPKQVKKTEISAPISNNTPPLNLYVSIKTFDLEGRCVGERTVDMCHYGTTSWLSKHIWWATHHGHCTEIDMAKPEEVEAYVAAGKLALAQKFNTELPVPVTQAA